MKTELIRRVEGFVGPINPAVKCALTEIFNEIERRAEVNMLKTHKLEGSHYAAMTEVRKELGVERSIPLPSAAIRS